MRKTLLTIAAAAVLASSSAWAGTTICQRLGDAVTCSDGTTTMPFGDGAYVTRTPRDAWGQPRHDNRGEERRGEEGGDRLGNPTK